MRFEVARRLPGTVLAAALALAGTGFADNWDEATDSDNGIGTDNVLVHGTEQAHDLGAQPGPLSDQDWFLVLSHPYSSYQFVVDGMTGDLDLTSSGLLRLDGTGTLLGVSAPSDGGKVLSLVWLTGPAAAQTNFVRVQNAACGTACTTSDKYRARFYETTYTVPRFNNSGTQTTVLLIQNATEKACLVGLVFLDALGGEIDTPASTQVEPRAVLVVDTRSSAPNQSGSVRIRHTCGYGGLSGKAVSVEPATGFTFDTPMLHRPR
jgi:hypothetical protein